MTNQMHAPRVHVVRLGQTWPHVPQLLLSLVVLTHALLQHEVPLLHALKHEPQF